MDPDTYEDVVDGSFIQRLKTEHVVLDGKRYEHRYFSSPLDIALALSTDGFTLFKRSRVDCEPLLLINLNLPAEVRTRKENLICVGLIPGQSFIICS
jgi:hypothetical protein